MADNSKTILIIDDEQAIRNSFSDYLEDFGFHVLTAKNGFIGIEQFKTGDPDLVMVDLQMPELNGVEVLKKITELSPNTPLVVVSGTGIISDAVEALRAGAWDYLLKPVGDLEILKHTIEKALEKAELKRKLEQHQKNLEAMVEKRTLQLNKKNEQLNDEILRRKKIEEQLRLLLEEKEILLKEVHHRVKNNMAIIISLMSIKSNFIKNKEAQKILLDCENRVIAMSLVHEKLYSNKRINKIDLREFISELISNIIGSYGNSDLGIKFSFEIDDIVLDFNKLISIGLIINEIITNSVKHAFKNIDEPKISVLFIQKGNSKIELIISDNGIGLSKDRKNLKPEQTGMNIIHSLVEQIDGKLETKTQNGTEYRIELPLA